VDPGAIAGSRPWSRAWEWGVDTLRAAGSCWATSVSGEAESTSELDLRRSAGGQEGWGMRVEFQVDKDANDHLSLGDQCDQAWLLATHGATQNVQPEDAAHELCPQLAMGRAPGEAGGARWARMTTGLRAVHCSEDLFTPGGSRRKHAMIGLPSGRAVGARGPRRYQGG